MKFRAQHPRVLEEEVFSHRMSLPDLHMDVSGGWRVRLWSDVCKAQEYLDCVDTEDPGTYANLADIWNWVTSMNDWRKTGFDVVPIEEAERRASICAGGDGKPACPHNRHIDGCTGCKGVGEAISALTGGRTTSRDNNLHQCAVCHGCVLKSKVHLPREVIHTERFAGNLPSFCWLKDN